MVDFRGLDFTGAANPQRAVFFLCIAEMFSRFKLQTIYNHQFLRIKNTSSFISRIPEVTLEIVYMYTLSDLFQFNPRQTGN